MRRRTPALALLLAISSAASSVAAQNTIVLEPETTQVSFTLQATGHVVRGGFHLRSGELRLDQEGGTIVGEIVLDATSAETGNKKRDRTLHGNVLESAIYPLIVLRPARFEGVLATSGASVLEVSGTVSLHGTDHPLTMDVTVEIEEGRFSAESTFSIPYVEWGLRDPSFLFLRVAKAVDVTVKTQGTIEPASE